MACTRSDELDCGECDNSKSCLDDVTKLSAKARVSVFSALNVEIKLRGGEVSRKLPSP